MVVAGVVVASVVVLTGGSQLLGSSLLSGRVQVLDLGLTEDTAGAGWSATGVHGYGRSSSAARLTCKCCC